ncbi:hypothetical protein OG444_30860 [Streptomyces sp. NBC_01232]|uniref:hypothetical protein n=1 Tax=Streptomyces sp. NBC_01232 TaxID=2903786 RepID=UPI002E12F016|nr:hypothetical protein OG444_30860 [Streptomyces sp. NBC_01232]
MSRRTRTHTAKGAAPTVHIPRQRGRREPVILVVTSEPPPTLTMRAVLAVGRWGWKHRRAWVPTGISTALLPVTGIVHLIEPRTAWAFAALALAPAGMWVWGMLRRRPASRQAALWRALLVGLATACAAWMALAAGFGPHRPLLFLLWAVLTLAAQVGWLVARHLTFVSEKESS